jgi:hypothetical protein
MRGIAKISFTNFISGHSRKEENGSESISINRAQLGFEEILKHDQLTSVQWK